MIEKGFCLYVLGRLRGVTRRRLAALVATAGGRLVRKPSSRVDLVSVAHSTAAYRLASGPQLALTTAFPPATRLISEVGLRRILCLEPAPVAEHRSFSEADIERGASLANAMVRCLSLYDVLEPVQDRYGYTDLLAAREVARSLQAGLSFEAIVQAAIALRQSGKKLSDTRLSEAPWGEIVQQVAGHLEHLDGQFALPLGETFESADDLFERAEEADLSGDLAGAERWYRVALKMDRADPVIPFNLGNVLDAQGRREEAVLAYEQAIARDPGFAEAWLNLAAVKEDRPDQAIALYRGALQARPDYPDALFNLAVLLTSLASYAEAVPLWDRYLSLEPEPEHSGRAKRLAMLCRLGLTQGANPEQS